MGEYTTHETLLIRLGSSDRGAWQEFYERYGALIRGVARRHQLQPADCDEVIQDVLTALSQAMPGFQYDPSRGKFRSYLKTVALHAIYRRLRQKPGSVPLEALGEDGRIAAATDDDAHWEEEWRQHHLRQAMKTIAVEFNPSDRAAFERYALRGEEATTTATSLGLSVDQVYQAKSRILRRLSELIDRQVQEEG